ncbi:uncharacterized protein V6R79_014034 [Siganus canaliculatus]
MLLYNSGQKHVTVHHHCAEKLTRKNETVPKLADAEGLKSALRIAVCILFTANCATSILKSQRFKSFIGHIRTVAFLAATAGALLSFSAMKQKRNMQLVCASSERRGKKTIHSSHSRPFRTVLIGTFGSKQIHTESPFYWGTVNCPLTICIQTMTETFALFISFSGDSPHLFQIPFVGIGASSATGNNTQEVQSKKAKQFPVEAKKALGHTSKLILLLSSQLLVHYLALTFQIRLLSRKYFKEKLSVSVQSNAHLSSVLSPSFTAHDDMLIPVKNMLEFELNLHASRSQWTDRTIS